METAKPRRWLLWAKRVAALIGGLLLVFAAIMLIWKPWLTEKEVLAPLSGGVRIAEPEVLGNFYASAADPAGAVLVIGGSDGGISATADNIAKALADEGFDALAISYWGAPGQKLEMKKLPLETFGQAMEFLKRRNGGKGKIALLGYSKGAEAALLLGAYRDDVAAVVAGAPTSVSWQAMDLLGMLFGASSTFSLQGKSIPFLPYANVDFSKGPTVFEIHQNSLRDIQKHADARIAVERIKSPLLLLCGGKDVIWPACDMASQLVERTKANGAATPELLAFPAAGHGVLGPPAAASLRKDPLVTKLTRTRREDEAARGEAWPKVVAFLRSSSVVTPQRP